MSDPEVANVANIVTKRERTLRILTDGPRRKTGLVESLDQSRSTLDRAIRELEEAGLVEPVNGGYRATSFGRNALETYLTYQERLDGLCEGASLLEPLPPDTPLGPAFLTHADVSMADPSAPDRVIEQVFDSVDAAEGLRGLAPATLTGHLETFHQHATRGGCHPEIVVTESVFDHLLRVRGERLEQSIRNGEVRLMKGPVPLRFGLWIVDDTEAGIIVYTETGIKGVAVNDTDAALEWTNEVYDRVSSKATPVTADEISSALTVAD